MATGFQYCAMLLLITMEISKQSVVGPSLYIMVYGPIVVRRAGVCDRPSILLYSALLMGFHPLPTPLLQHLHR